MSPIQKGTKLTDNPRNTRIEIRLTKSESDKLEECAKILGVTKTNVIVQGIEMVREKLKE